MRLHHPIGARRRLAAAAIAALIIAALSSAASSGADLDLPFAAAGSGHAATRREPLVDVVLRVTSAARGPAVPSSFIGLSTEYWSLPQWAARLGLLERTIALVHPAGTGRLILRIGGDSADHALWNPSGRRLPRWAFSLTPDWLRRLRGLVRRLGVRVILDLNLITATAQQDAAWARAARSALPPGSIAAFEIGNEPDIYSRPGWLATVAGRGHPGSAILLPPRLTAAGYARDVAVDAAALAAAAPGVRVAGPALARPYIDARWIGPLEQVDSRRLAMITVHRYPFSACARPGTRAHATIARILAPAAWSGLASSLRGVIAAARQARLPLRMTELNSVTCGGRPGVSDTFATALWAPDALFSLMRAGVASADIHVRANTINAPFALTRRGLVARPLLYGLILVARTLGPGARLLRLTTTPSRGLDLGAWAVRVHRTLHVLIVDAGPHSVRARIEAPVAGPGFVQRLIAPHVGSTGQVTFSGQRLDAGARWVGRQVIERILPRGGRYGVDVRRDSAALVSIALDPAVVRPGPARRAIGARPRRGAGRAPRGAPSPARSAQATRRPEHRGGGRASSRR